MNDRPTSIVRLCYRVETGSGEDYHPEATAAGTLGPFAYRLHRRIASFTPMSYVPDEARARTLLDPLVAAWNVDALLTLGPGAFQLQYIHTVVDDNGNAPACNHVVHSGKAAAPAQLIHTEYPAAPAGMLADDDVLALAEEYSRLLRSPGRLVLAGRAAIDLLERRFSDRKTAADALLADIRVLNRMAEITSSWGRRPSVEKITAWKSPRHISKAERQWMVDVLRALTRRLAQHVAGESPDAMLSRLP
jgi:hypothetical protein